MEIYFVTSNENKLKEVHAFLGIELQRASLDLIEIQSMKLEDVVRDKAARAYAMLKKPVLVEDTGVFLRQFNGFPGALIKWMVEAVGNGGVCDAVRGKDVRAYAETCFCLYDGKAFRLFVGRADGSITESPRGSNGFGWDKIFQPDGFKVTFAEMTTEEKNKISHRGKALSKLKEYLDKEAK